MPVLTRLEKAKTRTVVSSVFELPKPTKTTSSPAPSASAIVTPVSPDMNPTTYSVCTTNSGLRVAVIKEKDGHTFKCSRVECRR